MYDDALLAAVLLILEAADEPLRLVEIQALLLAQHKLKAEPRQIRLLLEGLPPGRVAKDGDGRWSCVRSPSGLTAADLGSLAAAIAGEIAAGRKERANCWLDIDAIEPLPASPGAFAYRLVLSSPALLSPDQPVSFHVRDSEDKIQGVVVHIDDSGVVVECCQPLPVDARLFSLSFDPGFILEALGEFVAEMHLLARPAAQLLVGGTLPPARQVPTLPNKDLDADQVLAVARMAATPLHLLWGPPGTGKTRTLAAAVVRWLQEGKRVLVVSTSNAAVDVALRTILGQLDEEDRRGVLRLGSSQDEAIQAVTPAGAALRVRTTPERQRFCTAQRRLQQIRNALASGTLGTAGREALFKEAATLEVVLDQLNTVANAGLPDLLAEARVVGCTLARMVLEKGLRRQAFDAVVVDEASMVPLVYALAASFLAGTHLVYAGDPKQLPPIMRDTPCEHAARWFGINVYHRFKIQEADSAPEGTTLLRTQYRMTNEVGGLVGRLSYGGRLVHGRGVGGPVAEFVDVPEEWAKRYYSVAEESYYHLAAVPLVHGLLRRLECKQLLLLTPYRAQRSLFNALAADLQLLRPGLAATASTIHRAQGSEAEAVVVDLTAHSPTSLLHFFMGRDCENLLNVAISRARDRLVVIGCKKMLEAAIEFAPYWQRVLAEFGEGFHVVAHTDILQGIERVASLSALNFEGADPKSCRSALYCHATDGGDLAAGMAALQRAPASRRLLVVPPGLAPVPPPGVVVRRDERGTLPAVFAGGERVAVPLGSEWLVVRSPNAARVTWRVAFSHLAEDEVEPGQAMRLQCRGCPAGNLTLTRADSEGWLLACTNRPECGYRRRPTLADVRVLVRLSAYGACPKGHPMTARQGSHGLFIGCENYPACDEKRGLEVLAG